MNRLSGKVLRRYGATWLGTLLTLSRRTAFEITVAAARITMDVPSLATE